MKKIAYLLTIIFAIALISFSCDKEDDSQDSHLRISKIADNFAMENPFYTFEYDSHVILLSTTPTAE